MVGVGVGSEEWWELDPPQERDELASVIFLSASKIIQHTPFMLEAKNEQWKFDSGYVSATELKCLPESYSSKSAAMLAA